MNTLIQIGDFARLGGVTVKALRFYDEQGLLRPAYVDPQTGYRYYSVNQAAQLARITNLRLVDFSIAEITQILAQEAPDDLACSLETKKQALHEAAAALERKTRLIDILMQAAQRAENTPAPSFKLAPTEDLLVYAYEKQVAHLGAPVTEMFENAEIMVAPFRAPVSPLLIFRSAPTQKRNLNVEVCIPVTDEARTLEGVKTLPGAALACSLVYEGGYDQTEPLYDEMTAWIEQSDLTPAGPFREIFHRFGADQDGYSLPARMTASPREAYLTELQIPITIKN
ncbi:MerR family transcriptional regulator [Hyphococcus luteus]|nr:MerR family transcriptional regulator [Marinicaulis flavus]